MTKLAASIIVRSLDQALAATACAAKQGADLVEFRIDSFTNAPAQLPQLVARSSLPCIITCRPMWEGGDYNGNETSRISMLEQATSGHDAPAYVDLELAAYQNLADQKQRILDRIDHPSASTTKRTGLILSSHDFVDRPIDLDQRIKSMASIGACRVMKIVWRANSLLDNIEAFEILAKCHKPSIVLCMGEEGLPSRVLAKKFGAFLSFASLESQNATAAGQPTIKEMKDLYRWDALGPETRVFGVIGHPVAHSMSPAIHNAAFDATSYNGVYLPMPIRPDYESFRTTVSAWLDMDRLHFRGASVTLPHKQNLLRFVQEQGGQIDPLAEKIGAANTLVCQEDGHLVAANTDYAAALDVVCDAMGIKRSQLSSQRVAVIGAGGVAHAIVAGFASYGATVVIYNRTLENAQKLANQFKELDGKVVAARLEKLCDSCCSIFINCTPIGMHPNVDATPIPNPSDMGQWGTDTIVFDTIYTPTHTRLLRDARTAGCRTIGGTEMFVRQAAEQFRLWTGLHAPMDVFHAALAKRTIQSG